MNKLILSLNNLQQTFIYALVFLLPLFFTPSLFDTFELPKYYLFIFITISTAFLSLAKLYIHQFVVFPKSPVVVAILIFLFFYILSTFGSISIYSSVFGYYPKIHDGLVFILSSIFLAIVIATQSSKVLIKMMEFLGLGLGISVCYGVFSAVGSFLNAGSFVSRQESTFGNVAFFSQAAQAEFFVSIALLCILPDRFKKLIFIFFALLSLYAIFATGTRSVWISFLSVGMVALIFYFRAFLGWGKKKIFLLLLFICISFVLVAFVLLLGRLKDLSSFSVQTSQGIRLLEWKDGIKTFLNGKNFWIGNGPETLIYIYPQNRSVELNKHPREWTFLPQNIRNVYLNYLSTIGLLGSASYILLICSVFYTGFKNIKAESKNRQFLFWLLIAFLAQITANFFYSYGVFNHVYLWVLMGIVISLTKNGVQEIKINYSRVFSVVLGLGSVVFFIHIWQLLRADIFFTKNLTSFNQISTVKSQLEFINQNNIQNYLTRNDSLSSRDEIYLKQSILYTDNALNLNPKNTVFLRHFITLQALQGNLSLQKSNTDKAAQHYRDAILLSDQLIKTNKHDYMNYSFASTIAFQVMKFNLQLPEAAKIAKKSGEMAVTLYPTSPLLVNNLGEVYWLEGNLIRAEEIFRQAVELKEDYLPSYFHLADVLVDQGNKQEAKNIYELILKRNPGHKLAMEKLQKL